MFKNKKDLFFDLDHTLWDYEKSSKETLTDLWNIYKLEGHGVSLKSFTTKFKEVNDELWHKFHAKEIDKDVIRKERFPAIISSFGLMNGIKVEEMQEDYINKCPVKQNLIPGALNLLEFLHGEYRLHIITNGFDEIQGVKLRSGGIEHYFKEIITSEGAGSQKPEPAIFEYALQKADTTVDDSIMIGDNPISDIYGAHLAGIDQVFYNPFSLSCSIKPTLEITSLRDLKKFF